MVAVYVGKNRFHMHVKIMKDYNDLPQGFQISATSRCCNEIRCN